MPHGVPTIAWLEVSDTASTESQPEWDQSLPLKKRTNSPSLNSDRPSQVPTATASPDADMSSTSLLSRWKFLVS